MKLTCLLVPVFLGAGVEWGARIGTTAELQCITAKSNIEAVFDRYSGSAAAAGLFAAGVSSVYGTPIVNARSMWGD
jgi:hypothetical protein